MNALKLALGAVLIAVASFVSAPAAQAAPTQLPATFNAAQHVYVMPGAKVSYPSDFERMLVAEAAQQNLQVYVIYTVEGNEALSNNSADKCLGTLLSMWSTQQGFPADSYLIMVCVQDKHDQSEWDYSGAAGTAPTKLGMTAAEVRRQLDKNKASLALDPSSFALYSVKDINARLVDLQNGGGNTPPTPAPAPADGKTWLIVGAVVLVLIIGGAIIWVMNRRKD